MWREILNIDPSCKEYFLNFKSLPGNGKAFIAYAGLSYLRKAYQIGKSGKGEYFHGKKNDSVHVHYLISTQSGAGKLTLETGCQSIAANTIMLIPAGTPFLYELDADHWDMCWLLYMTAQSISLFTNSRQACGKVMTHPCCIKPCH